MKSPLSVIGKDPVMKSPKHFLKLLDFTPAEIAAYLDLAAELKAKKKAGIPHRLCEGKNIALISRYHSPSDTPVGYMAPCSYINSALRVCPIVHSNSQINTFAAMRMTLIFSHFLILSFVSLIGKP